MSEKNDCKYCLLRNSEGKELTKEELEKVTGGTDIFEIGYDVHLVNGRYICKTYVVDEGFWKGYSCERNKKVAGIENVCTCESKTNGKCCKVYGSKNKCCYWRNGKCAVSK